jgi:hypothetical protein
MFALLVAWAASALSLGVPETCTPVPGTVLQTSFQAAGFRADQRLQTQLAAALGEDVMLAGTIEPGASALSVQVHKDQPHRSSEDWSKELGRGTAATFTVDGITCRAVEADAKGGGLEIHYDAYVVAAGFVFDLHVATHASDTQAGVGRDDFERIARSFRVAFVRHGQASQLPRDARDAMHRAFVSWPGWRKTIEAELARKPGDAALAFTLGELLLLAKAPAKEILAAHGTALAGYAKLRTPNTEQRFAWMLCEQALGLVTLEGGKPADALQHLQASYTIAGQLRSSSRASTAYALALVHATTGTPADAVRFLDEAIQAEPELRDRARGDKALAALAGDKRFQALVRR